MSQFKSVPQAPAIEIFELTQRFLADTDPKKVNLGAGAYRTDEGKPWVLPVVKKVEQDMANDETLNHEYLTILGSPMFSEASVQLLLGKESTAIQEGRTLGAQTLSGTGAIRLGAEFLAEVMKRTVVYYSDPSWPNHELVCIKAGFSDVRTYRYWDDKNRSLNWEGFKEDLEQAPDGAVFILHSCAHNPTGCDPTDEQWAEIAKIMKRKNLFPFFDCAYQGFASGDLVADAKSVRFFVDEGFELFAAQSFAKNFGLYSERAGNLVVVAKEKGLLGAIKSQLTILVRGNYSNPPAHGARIVHRVLTNEKYYNQWTEHIKVMSGRIQEMRTSLKRYLEELKTPGTWDHVTSQIGMFSYTGLSPAQCSYLCQEKHIYLPQCGRISICGLNTHNIEYVAQSFKEAIEKVQ